MEFVRSSVGFVAEEVGEGGVDAGGLHFEIGDVEFAQLCFVEFLQGFLEGAFDLYGAPLWAIEAWQCGGDAVYQAFNFGVLADGTGM